jgi:RNA-binding protein NOB1
MKVVIDANYIIDREIPSQGISNAYVPSSVEREIKDRSTLDYLDFYTFMITIRDPSDDYVKLVRDKVRDSLLYLSQADIDVVALTLELSDEVGDTWIGPDNAENQSCVTCLSKDNGVKNALNLFGLLNEVNYHSKKLMLRCYACSQMYDKPIDFCTSCGYNTITRVSVIEGDKVLLKKNYQPRPRFLKSRSGIPIISADQKEYIQHLRDLEKSEKRRSNLKFFE